VHNTVGRCSDNTYCCADGPPCNCTTGINTHHIQDFLPPYSGLVGSSISLYTAVATSSLFTPMGATLNITASTRSVMSVTTTSSVMRTRSETRALSSLVASTPIPTTTPSSNGSKNGLEIGLGVGLSLGALVIGLVAFLFVRWRRSKRQGLTHVSELGLLGLWIATHSASSNNSRHHLCRHHMRPFRLDRPFLL
jgi:hypothetical protein